MQINPRKMAALSRSRGGDGKQAPASPPRQPAPADQLQSLLVSCVGPSTGAQLYKTAMRGVKSGDLAVIESALGLLNVPVAQRTEIRKSMLEVGRQADADKAARAKKGAEDAIVKGSAGLRWR